MDLSVELQGGDELKTKLDRVGNKLKDSSGTSLIARAAYALQRQAQINATGRPGPNVITGRLRSSIAVDIQSSERARVGTAVFYAPFVEYGHMQHPGQFVPSLGLRLVADFCPAYPFLSPAVDQLKASGELDGIFVTFSNEISAEFGK